MPQDRIYSIGHSSRTVEEFLGILTHHDIAKLVDLRRFPESRRHPHFSRKALSRELEKKGIAYTHLGQSLGGYTQTTYEEHMHTQDFERGLEQLQEYARRERTVMMCAEKLPWQCHRRFFAQKLMQNDWQVIHILDEETIWDPEQPLMSHPSSI
jgi:uncharacterized protein (DUF488 family)